MQQVAVKQLIHLSLSFMQILRLEMRVANKSVIETLKEGRLLLAIQHEKCKKKNLKSWTQKDNITKYTAKIFITVIPSTSQPLQHQYAFRFLFFQVLSYHAVSLFLFFHVLLVHFSNWSFLVFSFCPWFSLFLVYWNFLVPFDDHCFRYPSVCYRLILGQHSKHWPIVNVQKCQRA